MREIKAELFAELPEHFHIRDRSSAWVEANKPGADVPSFLEGPCIGPDGDLWVVDIPWGRLFSIDRSGNWSLRLEYDGWPNGLKRHPDGGFAIADYRRGILRYDVDAGTVTDLITSVRSESFLGCNDLFFAADGTLYFTDQGQSGLHDPVGRVYRLNPANARLDRLIKNAPSPNGLVTGLGDQHLFVAMTRACEIWRAPLFPDGVSKVGLFARTPTGASGPDGMAVDADGNLYVSHASRGCVYVYDVDGGDAAVIDCRHIGKTVTNLAFGGDDRSTVFITVSDRGAVARAQALAPGRAY